MIHLGGTQRVENKNKNNIFFYEVKKPLIYLETTIKGNVKQSSNFVFWKDNLVVFIKI